MMPQPIIDSHHHVWDYDPQQYPWIDPETMAPLNQSYGLDDLQQHAEPIELVGSVVVQARQTLEENDWLLQLAEANPICKGVVGWVPLQDENVGEVIDRYVDNPLLKGVRHVIHDEEDPQFMLRPNFLRGLHTLAKTRLRYDILIFGHQLPTAIKMVDALPDDMPLVLDHIAKPVIQPGQFDQQWAEGFTELAKRKNVMCKLSGMAAEVRSEQWDIETLRAYAEVALKAFGPERLMFGSDWPVCLLKTQYARWADVATKLIGSLSAQEQDRVMFQNAASFYGLDLTDH